MNSRYGNILFKYKCLISSNRHIAPGVDTTLLNTLVLVLVLVLGVTLTEDPFSVWIVGLSEVVEDGQVCLFVI